MFISMLVLTMLLGAVNVFAADVVWDGDTDNNWSTPGNWVGGAAPVNGDRVIFSSASNGNLANGINDIDMSGFADGITIQVTNVSGQVSITNNAPIDLAASVLAIDLTSAAAAMKILGAGQITLNGDATFDAGQFLQIFPPLALTGGHLTVQGSSNTFMYGTVSGAKNLIINGTGIIMLSGANTITGDITLTAGKLGTQNADAIDTVGTLTLAAGQFGILSTIPSGKWPTSITIGAGTPVIHVSAASVCDVAIAAGANDYSIAGNAELEITTANTGSGTITVNQASAALKLSAPSAATGPLILTSGSIEANHATALDTYSSLTLTADTCIVTTGIGAGAWPSTITIGAGGPTIQNDAATTVIDTDIGTAGNDFTLTGSQNIEISGAIGAGATAPTINMGALAQVVTLSGANTYTGATTITRGTVLAKHSTAFGAVAGGVTVAATNAKVQLEGGIAVGAEALTINGGVAGELENKSGANSWAGVVNLATAGTNDILVTAGDLTISGVISGAFDVEKTGAGKLVLSGANTYTGDTTITAGVLNVQDDAGLGTTAGNTIVAAGGSLELEGGVAIAAGEDVTVNGGGATELVSVSGTNSFSATVALATDGTNGIGVTVGTLTLSGVISGAQAVEKTGAGVLTLTGINTYTGLTTVTAGTVLVNAVMDNANDGGITVANAATLGGTGTIKSDIIIQSGGILSPGNVGAVGTLTTATGAGSTGDVTFQGTSKFDLAGGVTDLLTVGAAGTLTVPGTATIEAAGTPTSGTTFTVATAPTYDGTAFSNANLAANYTQTNAVNAWIKLTYGTIVPLVIPTLNEWGMMITLILLAGAGFMMIRKKENGMSGLA